MSMNRFERDCTDKQVKQLKDQFRIQGLIWTSSDEMPVHAFAACRMSALVRHISFLACVGASACSDEDIRRLVSTVTFDIEETVQLVLSAIRKAEKEETQ